MGIVGRHKRQFTRRRRASFLVAPCAAAALLSGLGVIGMAGPAQASSKITLTYLTHFNNGPAYALDVSVIKQFEASHPGVQVQQIIEQSGTEQAKFEAMSAAGTPPNVYDMADTYAGALIPTGVVSPVDYKDIGYSSESDLLNSFLSGSVGRVPVQRSRLRHPRRAFQLCRLGHAGRFQGGRAGRPDHVEPGVYGRPKMLKMSGSKVVQEEVALPTNLAPGQAIMFDTVSREFGSPDFNLAGTKSYLTSAPVIAAATMLQNLVYKCHASVPSLNSSTQGAERYVYWNGNAAMLLTAGTWEAGAVATYPKVKSEVAYPYPKSPSGTTADDLYGYAYVVAKHATEQSLSWELAAALAAPGSSWLKEEGLFTGAKTVANSATAKAIPEWTSLWEPLYSKGVYIENLNNSTQIDDIIGSAIDSIILSDANVKSTLQGANAQILPLLNK